MNSHAAITDGALPRPGLARGSYPERIVETQSKLEAMIAASLVRLSHHRTAQPAKLRVIAEQVTEEGKSLHQASDQSIRDSVSELKFRLSRYGLRQALVTRAFAVICEISNRTLGMDPFDTQVKAGWVMLNGKIAEMQTGEGKTLAATLPAATAALAGIPVHVVTANDYLAARDAEQMGPIYSALGLRVGVISEGMNFAERQNAYSCDITYCTNKQVTFDYLRDRVERGSVSGRIGQDGRNSPSTASAPPLLLRGLCYAIVDEADSLLIDEARTPLILSRPVPGDDLSNHIYEEALLLAANLTEGRDFQVDTGERTVQLSTQGSERLAAFAKHLDGIWSGTRYREELIKLALSASHLYLRDREYLICDGKVVIVDDHTGRTMADRSWERGLHQMVEVKEGCEPSARKETLARLSYQRFFKRYLRLAGMTGTAQEVTREMNQVYGLNVVSIPTHKPCVRIQLPERIYLKQEDKLRAIVASAREHSARGRPVLIGTRSVSMSEQISELLVDGGLEVQTLNARQDQEEAAVIAAAGNAGRITVATNMAGRGTDIKLSACARAAGGLHVIVTSRNEAARIDRQLIGRTARQGDPGSYQLYSAIDDELPARFYSPRLNQLLRPLQRADGQIPARIGKPLQRAAQRSVERRHRQLRRQLEKEDKTLDDLLAFTGQAD